MKRGATSLIMREMHIKITMRCHLIQVRMAIIKNCTSSKCCGEFREKVGMEIDIATVANTGEIPLKLELKLPYDPVIEMLGIYTEKRIVEKTPVSSVHCSTAYNRQDVEAKKTSTDR